MLVAGRAGAGGCDPGPLPLPLQLCVRLRHQLRPGAAGLHLSRRLTAHLLPLRRRQRQRQRASVARQPFGAHHVTTGEKAETAFFFSGGFPNQNTQLGCSLTAIAFKTYADSHTESVI